MNNALIARGVVFPDLDSVFIAPEVDPARIHAGAVIHPGCRIGGAETAIGPGAQIGAESPVTLRNCQVGKDAVVSGGACRVIDTSPESTLGTGQNTFGGTVPTRAEDAYQASFTLGTP